LLPILLFVQIPPLQKEFWLALFLGGGLNAICTILYMKAIKQTVLALTVPLVAFTPLFLLLTSPFMVGELPDLSGIGGIFWSIAATIFMSIVLIPIMLYKSPRALQQITAVFTKLIPIGFFSALTVIFQMLAVSLTLVAHVIAIKRTSTMLSVLWGFLIFKEAEVKERLLGAGIMVAGVLLISLF
jgi:drug/metabolite transporter (DMT)-like permease